MTKIILYRGVNSSVVKGKVGIWWSTNPYYSFTYSKGGQNLFYLTITKDDLRRLIDLGDIVDATIDGEYNNYLFKGLDPENFEIKKASRDQINTLIAESKKRAPKSTRVLPGGELLYTPPDAIDIGMAIFGG